ncbi:MAG: hypothetical protein V3U75_09720 [Methylococcaceae bacterium]
MDKTLFEIISVIRPGLRLGIRFYCLLIFIFTVLIFFADSLSGALEAGLVMAFAFIIPVYSWKNKGANGLPFLFVYCAMSTIWYFLPLAMGNPSLLDYSSDDLLNASIEIFLHFSFLTLGYQLLNTQRFNRSPLKMRVLRSLDSKDFGGTRMLLFSFVGIVLFEWIRTRTSLTYQIIPSSFNNVLATLTTVVGSGCVMLLAFNHSKLHRFSRYLIFWVGWLFFVAVKASGLILAGVVGFVVATLVGLFLGSRKIPWAFILSIALMISVLNQGKFEMRTKYWSGTSPDLITLYTDWFQTSFTLITTESSSDGRDSGQSLLSERLSNLQMLLYVQKKVNEDEIPILMGETYLYGPFLMVPRFLWPEKPIAHMSQIRLNLHFQRQYFTVLSERSAYIAWGILPEAYGNFGPYLGAIISGLLLGMLFRYLSFFAAQYPLNSIRAMVALILLAMSFSWPAMESSVILTSSFQVVALIVVAGLVLGRRENGFHGDEISSVRYR